MGYVGTVSAACLADRGHTLVGVDKNMTKVDLLRNGKSPIVESQIDELLKAGHDAGRLTATDDVQAAIDGTEISFVCVGTPSLANGDLNLGFVEKVCREIGAAIANKGKRHEVIIRSTMLPGSTDKVVIPALTDTAGPLGEAFGLCVNPEFLREGSAVYDYNNPPKTVIGAADANTAEMVREIFGDLPGPMIEVPYRVAECVKYVDNIWHALKVAFANEIGRVCQSVNLDSREVMDVFKQDTKLNISDKYLGPAFAFGGSCLPKDTRAFAYLAKSRDIPAPIVDAIITSNVAHVDHGLQLIHEIGNRKVNILGFAFKAGTDDLRESPIVTVIEHLLGKGFKMKIFDSSVNMARLSGANKDYLMERIPHIAELMVDATDEIFENDATLVIGNDAPELSEVDLEAWRDMQVVDLAGSVPQAVKPKLKSYVGPGWPRE
jgi:GDP-mannose 6-dehydrogenase